MGDQDPQKRDIIDIISDIPTYFFIFLLILACAACLYFFIDILNTHNKLLSAAVVGINIALIWILYHTIEKDMHGNISVNIATGILALLIFLFWSGIRLKGIAADVEYESHPITSVFYGKIDWEMPILMSLIPHFLLYFLPVRFVYLLGFKKEGGIKDDRMIKCMRYLFYFMLAFTVLCFISPIEKAIYLEQISMFCIGRT
ncbi:MAG: hypothetical protein P9M14_09045 [Candidatus Alcyoniella australis]|nr:hypothetical protein [Candidatus Alcyoniella australis]